jgi:Raf kinase inhibitor-like YbhB/YbcL family protein
MFRRRIVFALVVLLGSGCASVPATSVPAPPRAVATAVAPAAVIPTTSTTSMKLTSASFRDGQPIPRQFTCDGAGVHPQLGISDVPEGAKSLALIVDDPDAPNGDFVHWVVFNMDPATSEIPEASVPPGSVEGRTSLNRPGWTSPCPPSGTHHYQFKLYALDAMLGLMASSTKKDLADAMEGHVVGQTMLVGTYGW